MGWNRSIGGLLALAFWATTASAQTPADRTLIRNVNLVTLDERGVVANASVLIENGRIARIGSAEAAAPAGATVLDGGSGWLMPGLIDAHVHFGDDSQMPGYLRYGVTTVFSLGNRDTAGPLQARRRIASGDLAGPRYYATGPIVANHAVLQTPEEVAPFMDRLQADGFEFVKLYNNTPQPVFDRIVSEARARDMGVFGHMPRSFPVAYTLTHGLNVLVHMEELFFTEFGGPRDADLDAMQPDWTPDLSKVDPVIDLIAANDVVVIPNLVAPAVFAGLWLDEEMMLSAPDFARLQPATAQGWREFNASRRNNVVRRMQREQIKYPLLRILTYRAQQKGVLLLAGTDAPIAGVYPGRSMHQELRLLAAAGLTNEQALRTATVNGGEAVRRFIDHDACIGVIREGCEADLLLLRANPLDDIRNTEGVVGVMADGVWRTRETLDRLARP